MWFIFLIFGGHEHGHEEEHEKEHGEEVNGDDEDEGPAIIRLRTERTEAEVAGSNPLPGF
ncbi:MAG: hypothetical protein ACKVHM_09500 [Pseudomonadales bacterium]|jgi:hypothetical protein|tara:strand:+ start:2367 stop:2546 length:180 start_codon:yes stop_codon:yes gene_type:complete